MATDGPVQPPEDRSPLFGTSHAAELQSAKKAGSWRVRILNRLRETGGATLWEVAQHYGVPDHVISGRFTELARDLLIERSGTCRPHPVSNCAADVWRVSGAMNDPQPDVAALLGYPLTLNIGGEVYDRQALLPRESYSGMPYARQTSDGGLCLVVRVELVECPSCGKPLKLVEENGKKLFRCGVPECNSTWECVIAHEPGQPRTLALVRRMM